MGTHALCSDYQYYHCKTNLETALTSTEVQWCMVVYKSTIMSQLHNDEVTQVRTWHIRW